MFKRIFILFTFFALNINVLFSQNIIDTLYFQCGFDFRIRKILVIDMKNESFSIISKKDGRNLYPVEFIVRDNTEEFKIEVYSLFRRKESKVFNIKDVKTKYIHIFGKYGDLQLKYKNKIRVKI